MTNNVNGEKNAKERPVFASIQISSVCISLEFVLVRFECSNANQLFLFSPPTILQPPKAKSHLSKQEKPITMNVLQSALRRTTPMAARRFASTALPKAPIPVRYLRNLAIVVPPTTPTNACWLLVASTSVRLNLTQTFFV